MVKQTLSMMMGLALACGNASAETVAVPCSADTSLHEIFPENNLGRTTHVAVGSTGHLLPGGLPSRARGLFRFDLSSIPANAVITNVYLDLKVVFRPATATPTAVYGLHRMLTDWNEGTKSGNGGALAGAGEATWTQSGKETDWSAPGGAAGIDFVEANSGVVEMTNPATYRFEGNEALLADVQGWFANPGANFGWMVICEAEEVAQTAKRFASRESDAAGNVLTVEFSVATAPELAFESPRLEGGMLHLKWSGGSAPYQLERKESVDGGWADAGTFETNEVSVPVEGARGFYRVGNGN